MSTPRTIDRSGDRPTLDIVEALVGDRNPGYRNAGAPKLTTRAAKKPEGEGKALRHPLIAEMSKEAQRDPDAFHGDSYRGFRDVLKEKPEHRIIMYLRAQCKTVKEIFLELGGQWANGKPVPGTGLYTYYSIANIVNQPWFKIGVQRLLKEAGADAVKSFFQSEMPTTMERLIALRDANDTPASVRLNTCKEIFDRVLGKPTQTVESRNLPTADEIETESERLDERIRTLRKELGEVQR